MNHSASPMAMAMVSSLGSQPTSPISHVLHPQHPATKIENPPNRPYKMRQGNCGRFYAIDLQHQLSMMNLIWKIRNLLLGAPLSAALGQGADGGSGDGRDCLQTIDDFHNRRIQRRILHHDPPPRRWGDRSRREKIRRRAARSLLTVSRSLQEDGRG